MENQDSKTNSENVSFIAYLDKNDRSKNQISKNIDAEDLSLFVTLSVQGGGKLENSKIEFSNSNFELRDEKNTFEKTIGTIPSEKGLTIELPIVARKDSNYNLSLLNMISQINLTGEYIDNSGNITDIDTTKKVNIEWTVTELKGEQVELSQEVITNKIYNKDGANKRIIQVLVKSNLAGNVAPVKSTKLEIETPDIGTKPEQVKVAAKNTLATNGKTNIEFANSVDSKYEYLEEEGKINIEVLNNADESNNVSWQKNVADEFVVTYVYGEETQVVPFTSNVKSTIEVYGKSNVTLQKEKSMTLGAIEEKGDIVALETAITDKIYKGYMYIGEDTNYETRMEAFVSYSDLANKIVLTDNGENIDVENLSTYYKVTKINKAKALDLLGSEGIIKIYNGENPETLITEVKLSEENQEEITIKYEENISKIIIETSKAVKEGYLEISNEKVMKVSNTEGIEQEIHVSSEAILNINASNNNEMAKITKTKELTLLEPTPEISVELDKNEISSQVENTLRITTVLKTIDNSNRLFKNSTINIELPKEITEATLENVSLVYDEELSIKTKEIITNESGNKVLKIELEGEQTKYNAQEGATIVADLKIKTEKFMASKNVEIKTICNDSEANIERVNNIKIVSKTGILNKSTIKIGNDVVENINNNSVSVNAGENREVNVSTELMNNYGNRLSETTILGNIPSSAKLKSSIYTNARNAIIYYSAEENATVDSQSWKTEVEDFESVKSFKIAGTELEQGEKILLKYEYELNETAPKSTSTVIKINGITEEQTKEETLTYLISRSEVANAGTTGKVTNSEKLSVEVISTVGGEESGEEVNNGQVIRYRIKIKNISNETINNLKLKPTVENGVFYGLVEDGGTFLDIKTGEMVKSHSYAETNNIDAIERKELKPGDICEIEYQAVAYIGTAENANQFKNDISITAENIEGISLSDIKTIKQAEISLRLHYSSNEEPNLYSNVDIKTFEIELINLTEANLKNIPITLDLPEKITCDEEKQLYFNTTDGSLNVANNHLNINIYNLNANETKKIYIQLKTKSIPLDKLESEISLIAKAIYNNVNYFSNEYIRNIIQNETNLEVEFTSDKVGQILYLDKSDEITYTLKLKNVGLLETGILRIFNRIPNELNVKKVTLQKNNGEIKECKIDSDKEIYIDDINLKSNDTLIIRISTVLNRVINDNEEMINKIIIEGTYINEIEKELSNILKITSPASEPDDPNKPTDPDDPNKPADPDDPNKPTDPDDPNKPTDPDDPNKPTDPEDPDKAKTYSISGTAWLDKNKNGIRDNNEEVLKGIKVILLDKQENPVKDKDGNVISTVTEVTGTYKFNNLEKGKYIVAFVYDTSKYTVTKYQVESAKENENSDAIAKQITIDNSTTLVGSTDIISLEKEDIKNIDIGLIENAKFDLSLEKYVSKVVVTNSSESVNYDFGESTLAKVEIAAKRLAGSTILVQYEIKVSNEGDVQGYVSDVIDYMPKELTFNSEMNPDWYLDSQGLLHNKTLEKTAIEPGKTQTVKLVLTKTLNNNSTGTIENTAEIGNATNLEEIKDIDSTPGNKLTGEDDIGSASLIISIKTGSPIMYIGIVLVSMLAIGLGIFIINSKILRNRV